MILLDYFLNQKEKLFSSLAVSAAFISTVFIFAPSQVFLTNAKEFNVSYIELLGYLFLIALPCCLILALAIFLTKNQFIHQSMVSLLLSLSLLLWLQGNILIWDYGLLTGGKINVNIYFVIIDGVVWASVIAIFLMRSAFFSKHAGFLSCIFIVIQLISASVLVCQQPGTLNPNRYEIDKTNEVVFSEGKNVIVLVLDTFESDAFQKIIDEDDYYRDIFDGFTYFRDALTGFPTTYGSLPNILTGQYYDNSIPFSDYLEEAYLSPNSILKVLKDEGFEVDCYPNLEQEIVPFDERIVSNLRDRTGVGTSTIKSIYDAALFRYLPDGLKNYIYNDGRWFLANILPDKQTYSDENSMNNVVRVPQIVFDEEALVLDDVAFTNNMMLNSDAVSGKYMFKFYRLNGCHGPYLLNEELEYEKMADNSDGYTRQARGSLKIVEIFLDELKRLDVFDNSMIFIIGDHGTIGSVENLQTSANPLFLVKRFNGTGQMTISDAPISLSDIPKTVFSELGLTGSFDGESIFNLEESDFRERRFLYYEWERSYWNEDYLPKLKEFIVSGHVWLSDSWRSTGRELVAEFGERPFLEWEDGFSVLEGTTDNNWRWCSSQGTLTINNLSNKEKRYTISARFVTGYPEPSNLVIESPLFCDSLLISSYGYEYTRDIVVPPGTYSITFNCDAKRVDAPADPRYLVFRILNFQIVEGKYIFRVQIIFRNYFKTLY